MYFKAIDRCIEYNGFTFKVGIDRIKMIFIGFKRSMQKKINFNTISELYGWDAFIGIV